MENFNVCPHANYCGGCNYQGRPYNDQLKFKQDEVKGLVRKRGLTPDTLEQIEGCPSQFAYRNKMEYTFGDFALGDPLGLGMHRKKSFMSIVTIDQCQIVHEDFNIILRGVLNFVNDKGYPKYNKKQHEGLLRNLIIRQGIRTHELLVNIVTTTGEFDEEGFKDMILSLKLENTVVGVLHTIDDNFADSVICEELRVLYGRDYYNEIILGLKFKVSAFSFFQTNVEACERLYKEALDLLDNFEGKDCFDLYCGTGTISQILALKAKSVLGIELVPEAVEAAKANAEINGLKNCEFIAGDVFEVLDRLDRKPDVIVVDPPRTGIQPAALDKIISYGVPEIVYISCNPKTLTDNLYYFDYYGYKCTYLKPFDNFPFTKHTETVALLSKLDIDKHIYVDITTDELDLTTSEQKPTYAEIVKYILDTTGIKVSTLNIAQIKRKCGIEIKDSFRKPNSSESRQPSCTKEKEELIMEAFRHFKMVK